MVQGSLYFYAVGDCLVEVDMPIYEYQCSACGQSHDALQKLSDAPLVDCSDCGQTELKKKISAVGFRLTGGGWYETEFKTGDKKKNLSGDSQSSGTDKPAASEKASESKKPVSSKTESAA